MQLHTLSLSLSSPLSLAVVVLAAPALAQPGAVLAPLELANANRVPASVLSARAARSWAST